MSAPKDGAGVYGHRLEYLLHLALLRNHQLLVQYAADVYVDDPEHAGHSCHLSCPSHDFSLWRFLVPVWSLNVPLFLSCSAPTLRENEVKVLFVDRQEESDNPDPLSAFFQ